MKTILALLTFLLIASCGGTPAPRKPLQTKSGSYFKKSIERSKKILAAEEHNILEIIKKDSLKEYTHSSFGAWYHYLSKNNSSNYTPKTDDIVHFNYNICTLENDTIYSKEELGTQQYKVDKQNLILGIREAIKLLKKHETATFLLPSSIAYGYHGDDYKIASNVPLKTTITILDIEKQQDSLINPR